MINPPDQSFEDAARSADEFIARGGTIFQKWTCLGCGGRCTANTPNFFTALCVCEDCGTITDVVANGCNYSGIMAL